MLGKLLEKCKNLITRRKFDFVINLPNRIKFYEVLNNTIDCLKREKKLGAVYLIDIDNFKRINDMLGHREGDEVLKKVALEIKEILSEKESLFRFGEDEFLIIQRDVLDLEYIKDFCNNLLNNINKEFIAKDKYIYLTISIGATLISDENNNVDIILKKVDSALNKAKELGKGRYEIYNKKITEDIIRRCKTEKKLRHAIINEKLDIHYQPEIKLSNGKIVGIEALLRWNDEELGYISPLEFIPIAEDTRLINQLGKWVLEKVCMQNKIWKDKGFEYEYIAVNISPIQFENDDFINDVINILQQTKLSSENLQLEITESLLMKSIKNEIEILKKLREIGVKIALDDFGTGYSSLNYLRLLPINTLKIDKSFVYNINADDIEEFVVETIIKLAHELNMIVIAEGVEEKDQIEFLKKVNCDIVQGYYYSKPLPKEEIEKILNKSFVV